MNFCSQYVIEEEDYKYFNFEIEYIITIERKNKEQKKQLNIIIGSTFGVFNFTPRILYDST
jgi:hypothetical protein